MPSTRRSGPQGWPSNKISPSVAMDCRDNRPRLIKSETRQKTVARGARKHMRYRPIDTLGGSVRGFRGRQPHATKRPREASGTRAGTDASSGVGASSRRRVLEAPGLLRRQRRTSGQVRDAARPLPRRPAGDDRLRSVRLQSSDLLPAARSVGAPRARRPTRCTPRAGRSAHLHADGGRLSSCSARGGPDVVDPGVAGPPPARARGPSASADGGADRGRWPTKKKRYGRVNPPRVRAHGSTRDGSAWLEVRPRQSTSAGGPFSSTGTASRTQRVRCRVRPGSASPVWLGSSHARRPSGRCTVWPRARRGGPGRWMRG